jgi:hypothetical protein
VKATASGAGRAVRLPSATVLRRVTATRYVAPLREGGSLPGLVEADDDGLYVVKFRGAGQGPKSLIAELLAGRLGLALALPIPELVLVDLDPALGRAEPDPEIQDLIGASAGVNAGLDFLPGALAYGPGCGFTVAPELAAEVIWFDALLANVDRTPRNPNLVLWHSRLWLIDHGAALYHQHGREFDPARDARRPFPVIRDHVLMPCAGSISEADARLAPRIERGLVERLASEIPEAWLVAGAPTRGDYVDYLMARLEPPRRFAAEAEDARIAA